MKTLGIMTIGWGMYMFARIARNGIREQLYKIKKRMGSKRTYLFRGCAAMFSNEIQMSGGCDHQC
jgi:hypothetical protein